MSKTLRNVLMLFACLVLFACLTPAAFADNITVSTFDDLWDAIGTHNNNITLTGDITINADSENILFDARDDEVTIPYGFTLTVSGEGNYEGGIEIGTLTLGGTVAVNEGGIFRVNDKLNVQGDDAQVQANGGFNLFPAADILQDQTDVISYPSGSQAKPTSSSSREMMTNSRRRWTPQRTWWITLSPISIF